MYHILLVGWLHHKNEAAIRKYDKIRVTRASHIEEYAGDLSIYDVVYCPSSAVDVSQYPGVKFVFGPHFSVFPDERVIRMIGGGTYIQPSRWVMDFWKLAPFCSDISMVDVPFGVDTEYFTPDVSGVVRNNAFIYFKRRRPDELSYVEGLMRSYGVSYRVFTYGHYDEADYLKYLRTCKFGIWLDAHESQGFALEEALSINVPLFVWNVRLLSQEYGSSYPDIFATSIPYWDSMCGEVVYTREEVVDGFLRFLSNLDSYRPREFVIKELSIDVCQKRFIDCLFRPFYISNGESASTAKR